MRPLFGAPILTLLGAVIGFPFSPLGANLLVLDT